MCLMFALLECLEIHVLQQNEECKRYTIIKGKNGFFSAKSFKFREVQMGHLHTCPLHLKLMLTTSLPHILHNEETRDKIPLTTFPTHN